MHAALKSLGFAIFCLVSANISAQALDQAVPPPSAPGNAVLLKSKAITALRETLASDLNARFPAQTRVGVFLELPVAGFVLQRVVLRVDQQPPITRKFSLAQSTALSQGHAERLLRFNAAPGPHHLRMEFFGYRQGKRPATAPLAGAVELGFIANEQPQTQYLVLPAVPEALEPPRGFFAPDEEWAWVDEAEDPRIRRVRFLRATGKPLEGLLELLEIAGSPQQPLPLSRGYHTLLALSYLDLDMADAATASAIQAGKQDNEPDTVAGLWLAIARLRYENGDYASAEQALNRAKRDIDRSRHIVWLDLHARVLMARQKYAAALPGLRKANQLLDNGAQGFDLPHPEALYIRYNFAVALIKSGNVAAGRTLLDRIGQSQPVTPLSIDLRNRANLALAYHFLDNAQGASAKAIFNRLPLEGQYANRALLGLGWTELAPAGQPQPRAEPGVFGEEWFLGKFEFSEPADTDARQLRRALVSWQQLPLHATNDPTVQAALLAIPAALEELGSFHAAGRGFERAVRVYEQASDALRSQAELLRQGRMAQVFIEENLAALTLAAPVGAGYASHRFQQHLRHRQDLLQLHAVLNRYHSAPVLARAVQEGAAEEISLAQAALAKRAGKQLDHIAELEVSARLGLARVYALAGSPDGDNTENAGP